MTRAQMRVAIAKDVLKQIKARKITISPNGYWTVGNPRFLYDGTAVGRLDIQRKKCSVCAAGAAITSAIRLFNEETIPIRNASDEERVFIAGRRWFTKRQLAMIEAAFEKPGSRPMVDQITFREIDRCDRFAAKNDTYLARAKAIFKNIIENGGNFVP